MINFYLNAHSWSSTVLFDKTDFMNFTSHTSVGIAVGAATHSIPAAFLVGLGLHYVADMIPHVDLGSFDLFESRQIFQNKKILALALGDIVTGLFVLIYSRPNWIVFAAVIGSLLPDIIELPFWENKFRNFKPFVSLHKIHETLHFTIKNKKLIWLGLLTQIIVIMAALFYAHFFDKLTIVVVPTLAVGMSIWFLRVVSSNF